MPRPTPSYEIAFTPARVIMQDFTGVPAIVDLAAMREAMVRLGGNPQEINPLAPAELVIDHSVQVDEYGAADALRKNSSIEFARNGERYRSCAGVRRRSAISRSSRRAQASCIRSTSSISRVWSLPNRRTG